MKDGKGKPSKVFGTYAEGWGETIPASNKRRNIAIQFRSNKKKNAGGFRCQVRLQENCKSLSRSCKSCKLALPRLLLWPLVRDRPGLERRNQFARFHNFFSRDILPDNCFLLKTFFLPALASQLFVSVRQQGRCRQRSHCRRSGNRDQRVSLAGHLLLIYPWF